MNNDGIVLWGSSITIIADDFDQEIHNADQYISISNIQIVSKKPILACCTYNLPIFSHVNQQPMTAMRKAGLVSRVGKENFCAHIDNALKLAATK